MRQVVFKIIWDKSSFKDTSTQLTPVSTMKIKMAEIPSKSWQIDGETMETVRDFILGGSKITADGDWAMKLKDACSLEENLWPTRTAYWKAETLLCQQRST